jgi:two-component system sensor histidine kinase/response regulator
LTRFAICILACLLCHNIWAQQYDSLEAQLGKANGAERITILKQLGELYRSTNPSSALNYFEAIITTNGIDASNKAFALAQAGHIFFRKADFNRARNYYTEAANLYGEIQQSKAEADVLVSLGGVYFAQGNLSVATDLYLKSLRYYESANDQNGMMNCYAALADVYARQNNFSKTIEYYQKAIARYEQSSNKMQALVGYETVGNAYMRLNNYSKATEFFTKALRAYKELNNQAGIANISIQLGTAEQKQGNTKKALEYFEQAQRYATNLKLQQFKVQAMVGKANCYITDGNFSVAEQLLNESIKTAQKLGMTLELEEAYTSLERIYQLTSESGKAKTFGTLSRDLRDSLYNDSILKSLSDLQLRYDTERQQREIESLSKDQQIRETELKRIQQLNQLYGWGTAIIVLIFSVLLFFFIQNKRYAANLQKQTDELTRLNLVKDRFFSIISHDLRNNMTMMKLYFDLISNPNYKTEDNTTITKQIANSVENTIDLLENLLVWASSQIKGLPINPVAIELQPFIQKTIDLLRTNAQQKQIEISLQCNTLQQAYADKDMLSLVIRNLIANAIKFTNEQGAIDVAVKEHEKSVLISVKDNGVGISVENLGKLFNQHNHPTTKGTGNEKGTGLGLLLCKDFVERNKGKIWVESEKGQGSTFYVLLPMAS